ncbi:MAG TPA: hypothetical protein DEO65_16675 [Bacillus bacterium]|uniref:Glycosyl transferase family 1 domain-containing protein n=1 Tax=Siminovitchia fordii TaxID=254759 RepID=A0ABQ4K390_9BACI|nr:glycosyltransferase [Siminovitchia fordii]GIN19620.1 hypothetical protein J1TS3_07540 [Siminovitchia fordii]HBZ11472.1 hypothetical protein [Bacillus sp. (in: firmicutes)]
MKPIIILSGVTYKGLKQRPQHFAKYFVESGYEVLYIGVLERHKVSQQMLSEINDKESLLHRIFHKNDEGVHVLDEKNVDVEVSCKINELLNKIGEVYSKENPAYIVSFPEWSKYLDYIPENGKLIYDCLDDWGSFLEDVDFNFTEELIYYERKIASIADLVIASSKRLYTKMSYLNKTVYYLPNGVWTSDYTNLNEINTRKPNDILGEEKPIVFFMGAVAEWVDIDLIDYIAKLRPNYLFVFVGSEICKLPPYDNISFLGFKEYSELPSYLFHSKIAIIPFKVNNLTASVTPLKLYEYLSSGTPVVSTMMPDIIGFPGLKIANNKEEFLSYIDKYITMSETDYNMECKNAIETAKVFDWSKLLNPISQYIEDESFPINETQEFVQESIREYKNYEQNSLIKNELLGFYSFLRKYKASVMLFDNQTKVDQIDHEKLALAYIMQGDFARALEFIQLHFNKNNNKLFTIYLESLLEEEDNEDLLKIFLYKLSGNLFEALNLADSLVAERNNHLKLLGLLSSLYLDIGEFDFSFQLAVDVISKNETYKIEELFDFNLITFIIHSLAKQEQFSLAEEISLSLMKIDKEWEEKAVQLLSDVYIDKHMK